MTNYEFWDELSKIFNAVVAYQEKSIEFNKRFINPWIRLGNVFDKQERNREALHAYQKAIEIDPTNAQNWYELGNAYFRMEAYDDAVQAYNKAIELAADSGWSYSNLALTLAAQGKFAEAIPLYRKSIELFTDPKDKAVAWNRLGNAYRKLNQYELALEAFQKADELDRENSGFRDEMDETSSAPSAKEKSNGGSVQFVLAESLLDARGVYLPSSDDRTLAPDLGAGPPVPSAASQAEAAPLPSQPEVTAVTQNALLAHDDSAITEAAEAASRPAEEAFSGDGSAAIAALPQAEEVLDTVKSMDEEPSPLTLPSAEQTLASVERELDEEIATAEEAVASAEQKSAEETVPAEEALASTEQEPDEETVAAAIASAEQEFDETAPAGQGSGEEAIAPPVEPGLGEPFIEAGVVQEEVEFEAQIPDVEAIAAERLGEAEAKAESASPEEQDVEDRPAEEAEEIASVEEALPQHAAYEEFLKDSAEPPLILAAESAESPREDAQEEVVARIDPSGDVHIEMDARSAHVWNELGNIYFNSGAYDDAIIAYSKAIELDRYFAWPYSNLALTYVQKGRFAEAILLYQRSIELFKDDRDKAISWNRLGNVYRRLDDYENAIAAYQRADELDPTNTTISLQSRFSLLGNYPSNQQVKVAS